MGEIRENLLFYIHESMLDLHMSITIRHVYNHGPKQVAAATDTH